MSLDFTTLIPLIDEVINRISEEAKLIPAMILTEDDLKCELHSRLRRVPGLQGSFPTQDEQVLGTAVHAELSWYGRQNSRGKWPLAIRPDITIIEPLHLSILHGYTPPRDERGKFIAYKGQSNSSNILMTPPLPAKQFEFGGKAITFELKFARYGIDAGMCELIRRDFQKMQVLFDILDGRGEGNSIFSYLVIFDKFGHRQLREEFSDFLAANEFGPRHKLIYKPLMVKEPVRRVFWSNT